MSQNSPSPAASSLLLVTGAFPQASMTSAVDVTEALDIEPPTTELARRVSSSLGLSTSPSGTFHPASWAKGAGQLTRSSTNKQLKPFATEDIKILLLENVNKTGRDRLEAQGYQVTFLKTSLPEDELIAKIRWGSESGSLSLMGGSWLIIAETTTSLAFVQRPNSQVAFYGKRRT